MTLIVFRLYTPDFHRTSETKDNLVALSPAVVTNLLQKFDDKLEYTVIVTDRDAFRVEGVMVDVAEKLGIMLK